MGCKPTIPPRTDGGQSDIDRILDAISHPRRRLLLHHLRDEDSMGIEEAANRIVASEHDMDPDSVSDTEFEAVLSSLYHSHAPHLNNLGIVDYDQQSGAIRLHDPPEELETFLELTRSLDEKTERV